MTDRDVRLEVAVAVQGYDVVIAVNTDVSLSADESASLRNGLIMTGLVSSIRSPGHQSRLRILRTGRTSGSASSAHW